MNGVEIGSKFDNVIEKPAKPRTLGSRTTLQDMRRRVTGISDFISRTQLEMAEEKKRLQIFTKIVHATSPPSASPTKSVTETDTSSDLNTTPSKPDAPSTEKDDAQPEVSTTSATVPVPKNGLTELGMQVIVVTDKNENVSVQSMCSTDIMDILMRKVHHWEQTYGKQGEKV